MIHIKRLLLGFFTLACWMALMMAFCLGLKAIHLDEAFFIMGVLYLSYVFGLMFEKEE